MKLVTQNLENGKFYLIYESYSESIYLELIFFDGIFSDIVNGHGRRNGKWNPPNLYFELNEDEVFSQVTSNLIIENL